MSMKGVMKLAAVAGVTVGAFSAANAAIAQSVPTLEPWFEGERAAYFWRGHRIAYTVRGVGNPVLLVHGLHAAASSYEWRHNFEHLAQRYRVYALDLLGFGLSDRPSTRYTAEGYISLLLDFVRDVFDTPPAIVASSLAAAYASVVAYRAPQNVAGLVLVCPTGLSRLDSAQNPLEAAVQILFNAPVLGQSIYNILSSEASIRYYL